MSAEADGVRIATRGSDLALTQAEGVAARVRAELGLEAELVVLQTTGDRIQNVSLAKVGGKGLFVKEIEEALIDGRADVAVHSAKDLPAELAPGLVIAAYPERVDPRDALVAREAGQDLASLPQGARVGTGSARRGAQLLAQRADLRIEALRGNVPTRLGKLESEGLDAVVLACAGLDRLGLSQHISERIDVRRVVPAVCQGTLALETRAGDRFESEIARLSDQEATLTAAAERAFLLRLEGDCHIPIAAHAQCLASGRLSLHGLVSKVDGSQFARGAAEISFSEELSLDGRIREARLLGERVALQVLEAGGEAILAGLRDPSGDETAQ